MSWPAALLWIILILSALSRGPSLLYLLLASGSVGTLQMFPGAGAATNLLPQSVCAVLFVMKVMLQRGNLSRGVETALNPQKLALFTAFMIYAICSAVVLPRLFAEMFEVVPVTAPRLGTEILRPGFGNVTQTGYMIVSYLTTLSVAIIAQSAATRQHFRLAILVSAYVVILTGLLDLLADTFRFQYILEPFRTVTYSLLLDSAVDNLKRVVGLMPEASSYGTLCVSTLGSLLFLRPIYKPGVQQVCAAIGIAGLAMMTLLSTSSTAYVGLVVLAIIYIGELFARLLRSGKQKKDIVTIEIALLINLSFVVLLVLFIVAPVRELVISVIDKVLFQKTASASYEERSFWTQVGWQAFIDSGGIGTGLGSIRVSNWVVSILGSTGVLGGALIFGFILQQLVVKPRSFPRASRNFSIALKLSLPPTLVMLVVSATMPDIGIATAAVLGMIAGTYGPGGMKLSASGNRLGKSQLPIPNYNAETGDNKSSGGDLNHFGK